MLSIIIHLAFVIIDVDVIVMIVFIIIIVLVIIIIIIVISTITNINTVKMFDIITYQTWCRLRRMWIALWSRRLRQRPRTRAPSSAALASLMRKWVGPLTHIRHSFIHSHIHHRYQACLPPYHPGHSFSLHSDSHAC